MGEISVEYGRYSVPGEQQPISKARAQKPVGVHSEVLTAGAPLFCRRSKGERREKRRRERMEEEKGGKDRDSRTDSHCGTLS